MNHRLAQEVDAQLDALYQEQERLHERIAIFQKALLIAGQYARDWLPSEVPKEHYDEYFRIICGGNERDPKGTEFIEFWLKLANAGLLE